MHIARTLEASKGHRPEPSTNLWARPQHERLVRQEETRRWMRSN